MQQTVYFCDHCFEIIEKKGSLLSEFLKDVCEHYVLNESAMIISVDSHENKMGVLEIIKYLELMKCIVTTEASENTIAIRPKGLRVWHSTECIYFFICPFCR